MTCLRTAYGLAADVLAIFGINRPSALREDGTLDPHGSPRHFYTSHPQFDDDIRERGIDLFAPAWHILDITPQGRGDWYAGLDY